MYLTYKSGWYSGLLYGGELKSWTMGFLGVDGLKTNDEDDEPSEDWTAWVMDSVFLCGQLNTLILMDKIMVCKYWRNWHWVGECNLS